MMACPASIASTVPLTTVPSSGVSSSKLSFSRASKSSIVAAAGIQFSNLIMFLAGRLAPPVFDRSRPPPKWRCRAQGLKPRPAIGSCTKATASATAASIDKSVVSSKSASAAATIGATSRPASRASRARRSASTCVHAVGAPSSARRRAARTSSEAVTKSFASASGQITVPMSRPSSTAPPSRRAKRRWKSSSAARTSGSAATFDAACPARARAQVAPFEVLGVQPPRQLRRPVRIDHARARRPAPARRRRGRAARCRGAQSRRRTARPIVPCPTPSARRRHRSAPPAGPSIATGTKAIRLSPRRSPPRARASAARSPGSWSRSAPRRRP